MQYWIAFPQQNIAWIIIIIIIIIITITITIIIIIIIILILLYSYYYIIIYQILLLLYYSSRTPFPSHMPHPQVVTPPPLLRKFSIELHFKIPKDFSQDLPLCSQNSCSFQGSWVGSRQVPNDSIDSPIFTTGSCPVSQPCKPCTAANYQFHECRQSNLLHTPAHH
jgi:hypothetical protein